MRARKEIPRSPSKAKPTARRGPSAEVVRLRRLLAETRAALRGARKHADRDLAIKGEAIKGKAEEGKAASRLPGPDGALHDTDFDCPTLVEAMSEGALLLTREAGIVYANESFAGMVALPLEGLTGRSLHELVPAADGTALRRLLKRSSLAGSTAEVHLRRSPGVPMPVRLSIRPLPEGGGKEASFAMVVSDLSEARGREDLLRRFSQELMRVQESERMNFASVLGDDITQLLCSILVRCELLAGRLPTYAPDLREEAIDFTRLLRSTASEVQRLSSDLRSHGLEILGLDSVLRDVTAEFTQRVGVPVRLSCAPMSARLSAESEMVLYRVLQEALRNVEQHAKAHHVAVTLIDRGRDVRLTIRDDGIGFDPEANASDEAQGCKLGLTGMRERATAVGGHLKVKSSPALGTEVSLQVPRPQAGESE